MPTPRAGSTGPWSASIPRPAAPITTRLVHPPLPPRSRVGAGARHVIVPVRPWDAREADSKNHLAGRPVDDRALGPTTSGEIRRTHHAVIGVTCVDARSSTRSPSRETSGPTAGAAAAREAGPQASTRRFTAAATRSSGLPTASRTSEPSPRASTNGRTSSTARSPWPRSAYGSVRSETPRYRHLGSGGAVR